jgi:hypothetical protein
MESFVTIISQVGFPIAITVYVLVRMEKKMEALNRGFGSLKDKIIGKDGVLDKVEDVLEKLK